MAKQNRNVISILKQPLEDIEKQALTLSKDKCKSAAYTELCPNWNDPVEFWRFQQYLVDKYLKLETDYKISCSTVIYLLKALTKCWL